MNIHADLAELVGNTPLLALQRFSSHARIVGKLEYLNPGGSSKDRVARALLDHGAREAGLSAGDRVLEKCGGNTAVSLAWMAARRGYRLDLVVPADVGDLQTRTCRYLDAAVHPVPPPQVVSRWRELQSALAGAHVPDQFSSRANVTAHQDTTGPEIWRDTDGQVDAVFAGIGTGGTLAGISRFIKPRKAGCEIVGVEPEEAPIFSARRHGRHGIPGIGIPTRPVLLEESDVDEVMLVASADAVRAARELARREGVLAGVSSGAVLHAAVEYSRRTVNHRKLIVIILCDGLSRYLSGPEVAVPDASSIEQPEVE
jgi:cysteine synthase A